MYDKRPLLIAALLCFAVPAFLLGYVLFAPQLTDKVGYLGAYLFILLVLTVMVVVGRTRLLPDREEDRASWLQAPVLITGWVILGYGLPGLLGMIAEDQYLASLRAKVGIDWLYFVWGWLLILSAIVCIWVAYAVGMRLFPPIQDLTRVCKRLPAIRPVFVIYGIAVALALIEISVVGIGYGGDRSNWGVLEPFAQTIGYTINARYLVLAFVALQVFRKRWPQSSLGVVLLIEVVLAIATGFMKPMLRLAFIVLAAAYVGQVQFTRFYRYALLFFVLGIMVVPVAQGLRSSYGTYNNQSLVSVVQAAGSAFADSWGEGVDTGTEAFSDKMGGRQASMAHRPGIIMKKTPSVVPYQGAGEFLLFPAYVIPRFLWTSKPTLAKGSWFSVTYMNMPADTTSSSGITIFGEPYMHGGWGTTIIAFVLYGLLLSFIFRNTVGVGMVAVYIALIPTFIDVDSQFTTRFVGTIQQSIVYVSIYLFLVVLSSHSHKRIQNYERPVSASLASSGD